jgi:spoIIIJ-associated protein
MNKDEIKNLIKEIIEKTNITVNEISIVEENQNHTWFHVDVAEPHFYINRDGEGLYALNHIVRKMIENKLFSLSPKTGSGEDSENGPEILIDINGFQKKRIDAVRAVAHMMAERARYFKSNVEVDPMSAFERRIVHEFLANETDLKTESSGFGPTRRVVIKYLGAI